MLDSRRAFLVKTAGMASFGCAVLRDDAISHVRAAVQDAGSASATELAENEDFWFQIQRAYDVDRSIINFNNGGVAPAPRSVLAAMRADTWRSRISCRHVTFGTCSTHKWRPCALGSPGHSDATPKK